MNRSGNQDITLQFKEVYSGTVHPFAGRFPMHILQPWHAKPTMLNLKHTHTGEWVRIPNIPDTDGGPNYFNFTIGRRERYIDELGIIRSAVAYGDEENKLTIWFDMEEMTRCLKKWVLPDVPFYWNTKKWNSTLRNPASTKKKYIPKPNYTNRGESSNRGSYSNRGEYSNRGAISNRGEHSYRGANSNRGEFSGRGESYRGRGSAPRYSESRGRGNSKRGELDIEYDQDFGYEQDQGQYEDYETPPHYEGYEFPDNTGVGRFSGPARHPRRENRLKPGYGQNNRRDSSNDSRANRDNYRDGYGSDRNSSRERRGSGAYRAHHYGYGK